MYRPELHYIGTYLCSSTYYVIITKHLYCLNTYNAVQVSLSTKTILIHPSFQNIFEVVLKICFIRTSRVDTISFAWILCTFFSACKFYELFHSANTQGCRMRGLLGSAGSFNNYVDQILPNFDHLHYGITGYGVSSPGIQN